MTDTNAGTLYERDYYAWAREQAALLRHAVEQRINVPLDHANLAEEVDDLAAGRRKAVTSQIRRALEHLLKLEFSAAPEPRGGWIESIVDARTELAEDLTPTLRREIEEELATFYERARRKAAAGLHAHGEHGAARALPAVSPYSLDDVLRDDWYPSSRHGLADPLDD